MTQLPPEMIVRRVRHLLFVWQCEIKRLYPKVKEMRILHETNDTQHSWDEWRDEESRLTVLTEAYTALKCALDP